MKRIESAQDDGSKKSKIELSSAATLEYYKFPDTTFDPP
jgi:hypothetical protein